MAMIHSGSHSPFLAVALKAVKEAEKIILEGLRRGVQSELKADLTPVTAADRGAEECIKQIISKEFPNHTFFGEEGEKTDLSGHKGYTWIIDPIDGTKSYIRGNPLFGTQLALMHDGELALGVSNVPLMNELLYAEKGGGAYLNGKRVNVSKIGTVEDSYMSHGSLKYFIRRGSINQLLDLSQRVKLARGIGDCWGYHLVAEGKVEIMAEADIKLWDIAAAVVIIEEAGGKVTELDGKPISPSTSSVLASNGAVHDELARLFTTES